MDLNKILEKDVKDPESFSRQAAKDRIQELREAVEYHDYLYYVKNDPRISDQAYDTLFARLKELEAAWPEFWSSDSPTEKVGAPPLDSLKKRKHTASMLSLDAVMEEAKVARFHDRLAGHFSSGNDRYVMEPKFDGLSVELVFRDGSFQYGATRGDGETGEDITENLKTIGAMPLRLRDKENPPAFLAVRAEVIMPMAGFQALNKKRVQNGEEPFSNPRNAAAGIVRQLDPSLVRDKPLTLFFYELLAIKGQAPDTHWDLLRKLPEWGLRVSDRNEKTGSLDDVKQYHRKMNEIRDTLGFEIDGVVVKINDYRVREKLGTRQRSPRWAIAWKFEQKKEITRLTDIVVQVGRTGKLTPVALLEPVDVGGVTVSRATLHNADEVHKKDVRPGDKVRIKRAGDVIPEVVERVSEKGKARSEAFAMPGKCPVCARLMEIPEIGPQIADSVSGFFDDNTNRKVLQRLFEQGVTVEKMHANKTGALEGLTFVFSGKLENDTRSEAKKKVEVQGGRAASSISGQTDYLVVGKEPGKKLDEAENETSVRIINEVKFREILEKGSS
jgi:DNA ligase (NAD+)